VALGAILYWAVSVEAEGFSINTIGLILMIVGVVGLILTLLMTASAERTERETSSGVTIVERD
jgi:predicted MFS family arabinose efflux permease